MFKKFFNTKLKRYDFLSFMCIGFAMLCMLQFGIFIATNNYFNLSFAIYDLLLSIIFEIHSDKYFKLTYQLKKNAKKEITKENK